MAKDTTNYIEQGIEQIRMALATEKPFIRYKALLLSDSPHLTKYPTITIEFDSGEEEWISLPRKKRLHLTYVITVYYEEFSENTRREKVREFLNKVTNVLRENYDFNGWALYSDILDMTPYIIAHGEKLIAGGAIRITLHKDIAIT